LDRDFLNEIWLQFETEALEHCTSSEDLLLDTNLNASEGTKIDSLFRAFHSLKGLFGTVGLNQTLELTHLIEDVIDKIMTLYSCKSIRKGICFTFTNIKISFNKMACRKLPVCPGSCSF